MQNNKSVIILNYGFHICGVSRSLVNFANALAENGYKVDIKIISEDYDLANELNDSIKVQHYLINSKSRLIRYFQRLLFRHLNSFPKFLQYGIIVRHRYDYEIAYNRGKAVELISHSWRKATKKIAFIHTDYNRNPDALAGFHNEYEAFKGYHRFDKVICVSEQNMTAFRERIGDTHNLFCCYNIIDEQDIRAKSTLQNPQLEPISAVAIGRLCEAKNYYLLLNVAKQCELLGWKGTIYIIGDGELRGDLIDYIKQHNISNVQLLGAMSNPYPYLANCTTYIQTSIYEGLSTTTIEALMIGKPIIATDCCGMRDILGTNAEFGRICSFDIDEIANELIRMTSDNEWNQFWCDKSRERAEKFQKKVVFQHFQHLINAANPT